MGRKTKTFTIKLSKKLCRSAKEPACGLVPDSVAKFPKITDVIEEYKEGIVDDMFETRLKISSLSNSLHDVYNMDAEAHFISIPGLEDTEADENISRLLARKNNVEHLFHKKYAELVVLVGYLEVVPDLITDEYAKHATQVDKEIPIIRRDISNILRKFRHFGRMLGVPDIRKKLCRYEQKLCLHDEKDRKNYALKIVAYAANKTTHIQSWFDKISAATENCELNSCSPARNVLSCDHGGSMKSKGSKRPNGGRRRDKSQKGGKQKGRKERKHRNHRRTRHQRKC